MATQVHKSPASCRPSAQACFPLGRDVAPDFVELDALRVDVEDLLVVVLVADRPSLPDESGHRVDPDAADPGRGPAAALIGVPSAKHLDQLDALFVGETPSDRRCRPWRTGETIFRLGLWHGKQVPCSKPESVLLWHPVEEGGGLIAPAGAERPPNHAQRGGVHGQDLDRDRPNSRTTGRHSVPSASILGARASERLVGAGGAVVLEASRVKTPAAVSGLESRLCAVDRLQ